MILSSGDPGAGWATRTLVIILINLPWLRIATLLQAMSPPGLPDDAGGSRSHWETTRMTDLGLDMTILKIS